MLHDDLSGKMDKEQRKGVRIRAAQHMAAGMIVVAVLGLCVAAGILLTTKSGKKNREIMKKKASDTVKNVRNIVDKSADRIELSAAQFEDSIGNSIDAAQRKAEGIKEEFINGGAKIAQDFKETTKSMAREFKE